MADFATFTPQQFGLDQIIKQLDALIGKLDKADQKQRQITKSGRDYAASLGQVASIATKALGAPVSLAFQATQKALSFFQGTVLGVASRLQTFVQAFSPASVQIFNLALQNLFASIGAIVQPLYDAFAPAFNLLNQVFTDAAATLRPIFETFGNILVSITGTFADALQPVLEAIAPIFEMIANAYLQIFQSLRPLFVSIGQVLALFYEALRPIYEWVLPRLVTVVQYVIAALTALVQAIFGVTGTATRSGRTTAAARSPAFTGIEEAAKQSILAAYGTRGRDEVARNSLTVQEAQLKKLIQILELIRNFRTNIETHGQAVGQVASEGAREIANMYGNNWMNFLVPLPLGGVWAPRLFGTGS